MRVALIQLAATPDTRSANISRLMRLINRAYELDPAPDLLVFPAGCEAAPGNRHSGTVSQAMGDALAGLLALKAREWGVFIAGGLATRDAAGPLVRGMLLDPDGDLLIRTQRDRHPQALFSTVRPTSIGRLGLLLDGDLADTGPDGPAPPCDVVAVPGSDGERASATSELPPQRSLARLARRLNCYVCSAYPVRLHAGDATSKRRSPGPSSIFAPDGSTLVRASAQEQILAAELDTPPEHSESEAPTGPTTQAGPAG